MRRNNEAGGALDQNCGTRERDNIRTTVVTIFYIGYEQNEPIHNGQHTWFYDN